MMKLILPVKVNFVITNQKSPLSREKNLVIMFPQREQVEILEVAAGKVDRSVEIVRYHKSENNEVECEITKVVSGPRIKIKNVVAHSQSDINDIDTVAFQATVPVTESANVIDCGTSKYSLSMEF